MTAPNMFPADDGEEPQFDPLDLPDHERYWADRKGEALVTALKEKESSYYSGIEARGITQQWQLTYSQYYGQNGIIGDAWATQRVHFSGEDSELVEFHVNEFRSFAKQLFAMWCKERPTFKCSSVNTDYGSMSQIELCDSAIDYVYKQKYLESKEKRLVEKSGLFGWAFSWVEWDHSGGDQVAVPDDTAPPTISPEGEPMPGVKLVRRGAPVIKQLGPWAVVNELGIEEEDEHCWRMVRERRSKWELMKLFPEQSEKIKNAPTSDQYTPEELLGLPQETDNGDSIIVRYFYHKDCVAIPGGRYVCIAGDAILWDLQLPFPTLPLIEMCPAKFIATSFGYADLWDLLSINRIIDQIVSDVATNLSTFGRQCVVMTEGTDFDVDALANGMRAMTIPANVPPPTTLNFANVGESPKWFLQYLGQRLETFSGLNAVVRGNPEANIKSGTMAALFHSIAQEFNDAAQAALDDHRQRVANLLLDALKLYADHGMIVEIAGVDERSYVSEFSKEMIQGIRKVTVGTREGLTSYAARMELGQTLMQIPGAIKNPEQLIEVLTTGKLKPLYKSTQSALLRIKWENEQLLAGKQCPVLASDNPFQDVPEHLALLDQPEARNNQEIVSIVLDHVQMHIQQYPQLSPFLAAFMHIPPPPQQVGGAPGAPAPESAAKDAPMPHEAPSAQERDSTGVPLPKPAKPPPEPKEQPNA